MSSSRLTRLLQEKAEALKRRRQAAEAIAQSATELLDQLRAAKIELPESEARDASLRELVRHSDWDGVESGARAFRTYLERDGAPRLHELRQELTDRIARLTEAGQALPEELPALLAESAELQAAAKWTDCVERLLAVREVIEGQEANYATGLDQQIHALATWANESSDHVALAMAKSRPFFDAIAAGHLEVGRAELLATLEQELPAAAGRRRVAGANAEAMLQVAQDLGVPSGDIASALSADGAGSLLDAPEHVDRLEHACDQVADAVRERVLATIESYRALLGGLRERGVEPEPALVQLEGIARSIRSSPPAELPALLGRAREVVEEPVVGVVAALFDEARPKLVEARRMGRNPSEVFGAMNRAREALRLKIYGEAIAASQEALDQVARITEDLDTAREEANAVDALLGRLASTQFAIAPYEAPLAEVRDLLDRMELERAGARLRALVRRIGEAASQHFRAQLDEIEQLGRLGAESGFAPSDFGDHLDRTRKLLAEGEIGEAAEAVSRLLVTLRTAAQPYVAGRLEEIGKSLEEINDPALVDPVRRLLADADISLRLKEDLKTSLETLRRAEREVSVVFAQHASTLVEELEEERRVLESMGGTGDEMQRQIDEVQQIFNMGDFVKAFRAAQDIRTRARQQQLVRSEEALSHAKLGLVELGKLGLDTIALRASLEQAQDASRDGNYPAAYRGAHQVFESGQRLRTTAQAILDRIREVNDLWESLKQAGVAVQPYSEQIAQARTACESLDFERARQLTDTVHEQLDLELARNEASRLLSDVEGLIEDGRSLGLPVDPFVTQAAEVRGALVQGGSRELWNRARSLHQELIALLRPVLEETIRSLERQVEVARNAELDVAPTVALLADVRRRLALPVPTGVAEVLDRARASFFETKGFLEHADRVTRRTREAINRAEIVRVDVRPFRHRLERIERHLAERDYARAIDLAAVLEREVSQAIQQQVSKTLAGFQGMLARARREGADTALAENLLIQARGALENGTPLEALQLATRSEGELERVELQVIVAQGCLDTIAGRVDAALREGLSAPESARQVAAARTAFGAHDYPKVLELAMAASDTLETAGVGFRRAREAVEAAGRQVREASEMNAELAEIVPGLERARERFRAGEYELASRLAGEAADAARWAIERLYAGPIAELQERIELVRSTGTEEDAAAVQSTRDEAEAAVKVRDWRRATEALARGRDLAFAALDRSVATALRSLDTVYGVFPEAATPPELEQRAQVAQHVAERRDARDYLGALELLREEDSRARERLQQELEVRVGELQNQLWVGEKLGIDTTPVMEVFSEAKLAIEAARLEPVAGLVQRGLTNLQVLVRQRIEEKLREVETELIFARDGLHVTLGPVPAKFEEARGQLLAGVPVDAARAILECEEELNRRKAQHRELMNLNFLVDAALTRATARRIDTSAARALIDESVRLRGEDYAPAVAKAREALGVLQRAIHELEPGSALGGLLRRRSGEGS